MKHKVGDKVRVRSKEWWDAQPKNESGNVCCGEDVFTIGMTIMCGKIVEIVGVVGKTYKIEEYGCLWTDEMFEDSPLDSAEKATINEELVIDIAEVIKKHNLGVSVSENEGKLIIEPLKKEEDLPIDTPCMCSLDAKNWALGYYYKDGRVYLGGFTSKVGIAHKPYDYIIPFDKFNPYDIEESLKYNIVK